MPENLILILLQRTSLKNLSTATPSPQACSKLMADNPPFVTMREKVLSNHLPEQREGGRIEGRGEGGRQREEGREVTEQSYLCGFMSQMYTQCIHTCCYHGCAGTCVRPPEQLSAHGHPSTAQREHCLFLPMLDDSVPQPLALHAGLPSDHDQ